MSRCREVLDQEMGGVMSLFFWPQVYVGSIIKVFIFISTVSLRTLVRGVVGKLAGCQHHGGPVSPLRKHLLCSLAGVRDQKSQQQMQGGCKRYLHHHQALCNDTAPDTLTKSLRPACCMSALHRRSGGTVLHLYFSGKIRLLY